MQMTAGTTKKSKTEPKYWFVAVVNNHSEKKAADGLERMGYETYVPTHTEEHEVRGALRQVERILLPAMVFIHCSEAARKDTFDTPWVSRYRVDKTGRNGTGGHPLLVIPDDQMASFRLALDHMREQEVILEETPFVLGEAVEVKSGELKGLKGNISCVSDGKQLVIVTLGSLACLKLAIPKSYLKRVKN